MNREQRYIGYIFLMIGVLIPLLFLLGGCTIYKVHSVPGQSAKVSIYSTRSFDAPELTYRRTGEDAHFSFGADSVDQPGPNDYARGVIGGIEMFQLSNLCLPRSQVSGLTSLEGVTCEGGRKPVLTCP